MTDKYILVVDDEPDLVWVIQHSLNRAGYDVLSAHDGLEALAIARRHHPALVILDINMPILNGLDVCLQMRNDSNLASIPILFLTVSGAISERVNGLDQGADDYMTKPFDLLELHAHIRALLRREERSFTPEKTAQIEPSIIKDGEITLDIHTHLVMIREREFELTPIEFDLLYFLLAHPQEVFTSRQLLQIVWNYPDDIANTGLVRWHIKNLRDKIEIDPLHPVIIVTISHQGYMFVHQPASIPNGKQTPEFFKEA